LTFRRPVRPANIIASVNASRIVIAYAYFRLRFRIFLFSLFNITLKQLGWSNFVVVRPNFLNTALGLNFRTSTLCALLFPDPDSMYISVNVFIMHAYQCVCMHVSYIHSRCMHVVNTIFIKLHFLIS